MNSGGRPVKGLVGRHGDQLAFMILILGMATSNAALAVSNPCCPQPANLLSEIEPSAQPGKLAPNVILGQVAERRSPTPQPYWPWWAGALALGLIAPTYWRITGTPFGVSGSWDTLAHWQRERARSVQEAPVLSASPDRIADAVMAETVAEFGSAALNAIATDPTPTALADVKQRRLPLLTHLTFIAMIALGGVFAAVASDSFHVSFDLGSVHKTLFGDGMGMWTVLFIGGAIAGFGARLGGGCTSGHSLTGLSSLQMGSMVSTACFFGTAIATSFALEVLL